MINIITLLILVVVSAYANNQITPQNHSHEHQNCNHQSVIVESDDTNEHNEHDEHNEHNEHSEHDEHDEHDEHEDEFVINLTDRQIDEIGLTSEIASAKTLNINKSYPAIIKLNQDNISYVVPNISGKIVEIPVTFGSNIHTGDVVAVIESRELADLKTDYMQQLDTVKLTEEIFKQEESLWKDKIASKQDYLKAKSEYQQAQIQLRSAIQKLKAIGFTDKAISSLPNQEDEQLTKYEVKSSFEGVIIDKKAVLGEFVEDNSELFLIADTTAVWADINIFPTDADSLEIADTIEINTGQDNFKGTIFYISPVVSESSKTILARALVNNIGGKCRPGSFAKANITTKSIQAEIAVRNDAIVNIDNEKCIFVVTDHGFKAVPIQTGISNHKYTQIISGIDVGDKYVDKGAFELKSKIITSNLDPHAGHGH